MIAATQKTNIYKTTSTINECTWALLLINWRTLDAFCCVRPWFCANFAFNESKNPLVAPAAAVDIVLWWCEWCEWWPVATLVDDVDDDNFENWLFWKW